MSQPTSPGGAYQPDDPRPASPAPSSDVPPMYSPQPTEAPPTQPYPSIESTQPTQPQPAESAATEPYAAPVFTPGSAAVPEPFAVPDPTRPMAQSPSAGFTQAAATPGFPPPPVGPESPAAGGPTAAYPQVGEFAGYGPTSPMSPTGATGPTGPTGPEAAPYPAGGFAPHSAPQPSKPRGRAGLVVLSIVAAFLLVATGVLAALYMTKTTELNRTERQLNAQLAQRDSTISAQDDKIDQLEKDLQTTKDELAEVRQALTGTQNTAEETKRQKGVIVKCITLLGEANALAERGETSRAQAKFAEAEPVCDEADRYLVP